MQNFLQSSAEEERLSRLGDPNAYAESNKYDVKNLSFPYDLLNNRQYGGNYAIFYINVQSDSKLITKKGATTVDVTDRNVGSYLSGAGLTQGGTIAATGAIGATGGSIASIVTNNKSDIVKGAALGGGAATAQIAAAQKVDLSAEVSKPLKRLQTAIALHMPNQLNTRYGAQYDEQDTSIFQAFALGGSSLIDAAATASTSSASAGIDKLKSEVLPIIASQTAKVTPDALQRLTRSAPNPKKEQMFRGVDFRNFTFSYEFFPRSQQEANNILGIIKTFKYHMHPEFIDNQQFLFSYPSEFDIKFYKNGEENTRINKITSCVLVDLSINYTPSGVFNTFADGTPTQINVNMTFKELAVLDKDKIDMGF